ncbi:MAG TPA: sugar phosphate isomerase/epimerase [Sphingobacterium sp.]|nr:sugar phosphate isomerase/epimerase [Sphingobacterium sp.]
MKQDRRKFIKNVSFGLSAALLSPYILQSCKSDIDGKSPFHNLGIQLYTVRDLLAIDAEQTLKNIRKIGFKHVETFGFENDQFWGLSPSALKNILKDNNLSTHSGHYALENFLDKESTERENIENYIEVAHELGQKYIIAPAPSLEKVNDLDAEDYQFMAEQLNKLGEMAKKADIKVGYHNHYWEFKSFANGTKGLDILIAFTEPDLVDFQLDLFWVEKAGFSPQSYFDKYPGRFTLWHVKDMDRNYAEPILEEEYKDLSIEEVSEKIKFTEVGSGAINFTNIIQSAEKAGLKYAFLEQDEIYMEDKFASLKKSYDYIQKNLVK